MDTRRLRTASAQEVSRSGKAKQRMQQKLLFEKPIIQWIVKCAQWGCHAFYAFAALEIKKILSAIYKTSNACAAIISKRAAAGCFPFFTSRRL